jgi:hypothetical protein
MLLAETAAVIHTMCRIAAVGSLGCNAADQDELLPTRAAQFQDGERDTYLLRTCVGDVGLTDAVLSIALTSVPVLIITTAKQLA